MKKCLILIWIFSLSAAGCRKDEKAGTPVGVYKGIVLHNICCLDVVRVIDNDSVGQDTWVDSNKTPLEVYHHVFKVANPCQFGNIKEGDTISFKVIPQETQTCVCCMIYIFTPSVSYPIRVLY